MTTAMLRTVLWGVTLMGTLLGQTGLAAELDWKLKKSRDGISAWTARLDNNDHLAFRGETLLRGKTLDQVITVMRDVSGMAQWLHTCYDPVILQEEEDMSRIVHMKNHTPTVFVAERDLVLRQQLERTSPTTARLTLTGLPDYLPPQKSFVRIPFFDGKWEFEQTVDGVRAVYSGVIDPGGGLPASITNMMVVDTPFETLKNLSRFLAR
jgi:hypothetical protein